MNRWDVSRLRAQVRLLGGHRAEPSSEDGIQNSASGARYAFHRKHAPRESLGATNGDHAPKEPPKGRWLMSLADRAGGAKGKWAV
jgi:hypothetical protein